jgi:hypothetical protein
MVSVESHKRDIQTIQNYSTLHCFVLDVSISSLSLKKLSKENVNKYYKTWFNTDIPQDVYDNMKDRNVSQADLGNIFASKDFETIHKKLVE